jgi:hypothetical protein
LNASVEIIITKKKKKKKEIMRRRVRRGCVLRCAFVRLFALQRAQRNEYIFITELCFTICILSRFVYILFVFVN